MPRFGTTRYAFHRTHKAFSQQQRVLILHGVASDPDQSISNRSQWRYSDCRVHGRHPANDTVGCQVCDLRVGQAQLGQQPMIVLPQQRCGLSVKPAGSAGEPHRHGAEPSRAVHRMLDEFEKAAGRQLDQLSLPMRLHNLGHRHTGLPECCDDLIATQPLTPRGQMLIDEVLVLTAARCGGQRGIRRPGG